MRTSTFVCGCGLAVTSYLLSAIPAQAAPPNESASPAEVNAKKADELAVVKFSSGRRVHRPPVANYSGRIHRPHFRQSP